MLPRKTYTEVIKSRSAIHVSNVMTLLQRRAWNVLLANAYEDLHKRDLHTMRTADLIEYLGITTQNHEHIEGLIKALQKTVVKFDLFGREGRVVELLPLLGDVRLESGTISYSYGPILREKLSNPQVYARIRLTLTNRFSSKHALAIYELCFDYKDLGTTGPLPVDQLREYLGFDGEPPFDHVDEHGIVAGVKEVNESDKGLRITPRYHRIGEKVMAVEFLVEEVAEEALPRSASPGEVSPET